MFRNFDKDKSGCLSIAELAGLLAQLGLAVKDHELVAMMKIIDTSKNGTIEFDEFERFIIVDPYKKYQFSWACWEKIKLRKKKNGGIGTSDFVIKLI